MFKLKISKTAYLKIKYYTAGVNTEISGLGKVVFQHGDFIVQDAEIFSQAVSAVSSTLSDEALAKFLYQKISKGESVKEYKFWWHSHVNMQAFFSSIDDATIDMTTIEGYLISLVTNKRGDMLARLDIYSPLRLTFPLTVELFIEDDNKIKKICTAEITKKLNTVSLPSWSNTEKKISILEDKPKYSTHRNFKATSASSDLEASAQIQQLP